MLLALLYNRSHMKFILEVSKLPSELDVQKLCSPDRKTAQRVGLKFANCLVKHYVGSKDIGLKLSLLEEKEVKPKKVKEV